MSARKAASVRVTANFEANLAEIEKFWAEAGASEAYAKLIDELLSTTIQNLESFPGMGRPMLTRTAESAESQIKQAQLKKRLTKLKGGGEIRQYMMDDYLVLYLEQPKIVSLLAIRHHRQLSFDFGQLWLERQG